MLIWIGKEPLYDKQPMTVVGKDNQYITIRLLNDKMNWKVSKKFFEENFKMW